MARRGVMRNRNNQIVDYSGLRYGNKTPTDLDGFMDFDNKLFVFLELKYANAPLPAGQEIALVRLVDTCYEADKLAILLIATHYDEADIDAAAAIVTRYRWGKGWIEDTGFITVKQAIDKLIQKYL